MIEAVRRNDPVRCPVCPRTVERRSRQQVYCSPRCRKRAGRGRTTRGTGAGLALRGGSQFRAGRGAEGSCSTPGYASESIV